MKIQQSYIVDAARTPIARVKGGKCAYSEIHPVDLASTLVKEVVKRNNLNPQKIDDCLIGVTVPVAEQGLCIGRQVSIVGLDEKVAGAAFNRMGGSGLDVIEIALSETACGFKDLVVAGGIEDMSLLPLGADGYPIPKDEEVFKRIKTEGVKVVLDTLPKSFFDKHEFKTVLESAEMIARKFGITRKELDEYACKSQSNANKAQQAGYFKREISPIQTQRGLITQDDGIRADTNIEKLAALKPILPLGLHTAGNSSQVSTGAALTLIANEEAIKKYNFTPRAKLIGFAVTGSNVEEQLTGPISAIPKALENAGLKIEDIDLFEISEAFAAEVLAIIKELKIDPNKVNVNGGGISIGHPAGASGTRLFVTGLHELERRFSNKEPNNKYLLVTLCIGFGQGIAAIFERV